MEKKISACAPQKLAKLRGVIYDVPFAMSMDEKAQEVKGGKVVKAARLQTQRKGLKSDSLSVVLQFENSECCVQML